MARQINGAETSGKRLRYKADEAMALVEGWFRKRAERMSRIQRDLSDDLVQEMCMAVLRCRGKHTLGFFKRRGVLRAIDVLRREKRHRQKRARYKQLSHPIMEDDDTPFIEGLIDLESKLSSRPDEGREIVTLYPESRASA